MKISFKTVIYTVLTGLALASFACHAPAFAAKGAGHGGGARGAGHESGSHDTGTDEHHDDHSADGSHSDSHKGGGGKGPQFRGGRDSHKGDSDGGHGVEDDIFHGKQGMRWSDDWPGASHESGEDHDHEDSTHDHTEL